MMSGHGEPDLSGVLRNTKTLEAYRARMRAARRQATPFFLLPAMLNPAMLFLGLPRFRGALRQAGPAVWWICAVAWLFVTLGAIAIGVYRQQKYLRDHPFIDP